MARADVALAADVARAKVDVVVSRGVAAAQCVNELHARNFTYEARVGACGC
jgi:hypothetical protein